MKVLLSSGYGRLHLAQSAEWLGRVGLKVWLLCGWVPHNPSSFLVRICSKIVGRDLSPGLQKRAVKLECGGKVCPCSWADFMCNGLFVFDRLAFGGRFHNRLAIFAWSVFGWQARRFIRMAAKSDEKVVFHVRSGAGQGGAIKEARMRGMKVIVDHSALHPEQTETNLKAEYERWHEAVPIAPHSGVWVNVLKDCAEADILMVNANHIRDSFVSRGYDPSKIRVVYLGVREDFRELAIKGIESGEKDELPHVLFTGNFSLLKGAEYLLESLRILAERGVAAHYDVVGALAVPKSILGKYTRLPISFHGPVPQDDLKKFLTKSDIYLFPSLADGCAQSGMEALTAGLPVVATYQSGLPITDGETGCVVPMKNAAAIADKIEWLIANPRERERLGRNAAKMMREKYTWLKYAERVKQIYSEMSRNEI